MEKNRCVLCDGRIVNGRCKECGMDYSRREQRYRLNETRAVGTNRQQTRARGKMSGSSDKKKSSIPSVTSTSYGRLTSRSTIATSRGGDFLNWENKKSRDKEGKKNEQKTKKKRKGRIVSWIAGLLLIGSLAEGLLSDALDSVTSFLDNTGDFEVSDDFEEYDTEYDPYWNVDEEMPDTGEEYINVLTQGAYIGGQQIPIGTYTISLADENEEYSGWIYLNDEERGIYINKYLAAEGEDAETSVDDIRLYEGGILEVGGSIRVEITAENAQMDEMEAAAAQLDAESVQLVAAQLTPGVQLIAGENIPAGTYDMTVAAGEGSVEIIREDETVWTSWMTVGTLTGEYQNLKLLEGDQLVVGDYHTEDFVVNLNPGGSQ